VFAHESTLRHFSTSRLFFRMGDAHWMSRREVVFAANHSRAGRLTFVARVVE
jgi:hypothetical protein